MAHDAETIEKDKDAIAHDRCPETGVDLTNLDVYAHRDLTYPHWQDLDCHNPDYLRRAKMLTEYADKRAAVKTAKG